MPTTLDQIRELKAHLGEMLDQMLLRRSGEIPARPGEPDGEDTESFATFEPRMRRTVPPVWH